MTGSVAVIVQDDSTGAKIALWIEALRNAVAVTEAIADMTKELGSATGMYGVHLTMLNLRTQNELRVLLGTIEDLRTAYDAYQVIKTMEAAVDQIEVTAANLDAPQTDTV